jgi:site-specific DNA recombinase
MRGRKAKVEQVRFAYGYCRVSTREQSADGHSLEAQESRLRALAHAQGVELGKVFVDAGFSAKSLKRPAITELIAAIKAGEVSAVYVGKLDRLTRRLEDLLALVALCEKHGTALVSASESIDTGSPAGKMMLHMLGVIAEFERGRISERIKDTAFDLRSKRRVYCRNAAFGYRRQGDSLVPEPQEQRALTVIKTMHSQGASFRQIAQTLEAQGVPPKGKAWYGSSVRAILNSRMAAA